MESVHFVLYFNWVFNLYELMIAEYLAFHMEILLFFPIIRSVPS